MRFSVPAHQNYYIGSARAQFEINAHRYWNYHLCLPDGLSVVQCSLGHVIGVVFLDTNFSDMKRTCWTTGSWRSCLCLEVVSSIPAGSMIIHRFLCGFICVSLCQSIKIKPTNMYRQDKNYQHARLRVILVEPLKPVKVILPLIYRYLMAYIFVNNLGHHWCNYRLVSTSGAKSLSEPKLTWSDWNPRNKLLWYFKWKWEDFHPQFF